MSGGGSWGGRDRSSNSGVYTSKKSTGYSGYFSTAFKAYDDTSMHTHTNCVNCDTTDVKSDRLSMLMGSQVAPNLHQGNQVNRITMLRNDIRYGRMDKYTDFGPKKLKTTKKNVLIVMLDMTGSMGTWRETIFKFLVDLYTETQGLLGDDLDILFIVYGDVKFGDPIQIATFGDGPELDNYLASFNDRMQGGGDGEESPEIPLYYVNQEVDVSDATNVYCYVVTDEACASTVDKNYLTNMGLTVNDELLDTKALIRSLLRKMELFVILGNTTSREWYLCERNGPCNGDFQTFWEDMVGKDRVLPLERDNLVIETILASIARKTDQDEKFSVSYQARRGDTEYGVVNLDLVQRSVMNVTGGSTSVTPPTVSGSRNLADFLDD